MSRAQKLLFALASVAGITQGCDCGSESDALKENGCGYDCKQACTAALPIGVIGGYTSVVKTPDGRLFVAGYSDSAYTANVDAKYGDLVYGEFNRQKGEVEWQLVDGVPGRKDDSCPSADRKGWRGGEDNAGDDVGLWTSIQLDPRGRAMIAYYDYTHRTLRFARVDGGSSSYALTEEKKGVDSGRFAKQLILAGRPVVAFSSSEPGTAGRRRSKITLAKSLSDFPSRGADWQFEDIWVREDAPCLPNSCDDGSVCLADTGVCAPTVSGCTPACAADVACVTQAGKAVCLNKMAEKPTAYPSEIGSYLKMTSSAAGLAIVAYDRIEGNLVGVSNADGKWKSQVLDGANGNVGLAPSIAVDTQGDWHVAYVNVSTGALQYVRVVGGKTAGKPEIIDDASGIGGTAFSDGIHKIGDDSEIRVATDGSVEILYQDATVGTLRYAKAPASNGAHAWTINVATQPGRFAGFFPHWVPGTPDILNFWRSTSVAEKSIAGNVSLVSPP